MIPTKEYARIHKVSQLTVVQKCRRGGFYSARKIGRDWYIDESEPYQNFNSYRKIRPRVEEVDTEVAEVGDIPLKKWCEINGLKYKSQQQKAIRGGFSTARKIGNQWFINVKEKPEDKS